MTWSLDTGAVMAAVGLVGGLGVPALIARIPEPVPADGDDDPPPKEPYVAVASLPRLRWKAATAAALAAGLVGARTGWSWALLLVAYLVPVGVALAVVDWRTRLLPTKVIAPSYVVVVVLCVVAAALGDGGDLARAGWGWLVAGGTFLLLWVVYPKGMGYGDVRLSGLLGLALGFLGWGPLLVGVYAGFLLGGLGGAALTMLRLVDRRAYPFGPFMLLGAVVGVLAGDWFAAFYRAS
jgi:leader peptidase (prepilin peptidase) / N-methyltransferase